MLTQFLQLMCVATKQEHEQISYYLAFFMVLELYLNAQKY
jgi:hypothetical protein